MVQRLDDATVGAFLRELEDIETQVQRVEYADLPFASGTIVPLEIQNKPWAREVTYRQITKTGRFALQRSYSSNVPMIDVLSEEFTQKVHKFAGGYWFSDDDIEAVVHTGMDLESEKVAGVKEASEQEMNELIAFGDPKIGMHGFLNDPNILYSFAPYKIDGSSTPMQILALLHDSVTAVVKLTKQVEKPDTMLLPVDQYHYLANTMVSDKLQVTLLKQFLETSPYIKDIESINELAGAGADGTDLMYIYRRDKNKVKARIMQALKFLNLERKGLGYERSAVFKYGGIVSYRPFSRHAVAGI
jgi:hypothetical protein